MRWQAVERSLTAATYVAVLAVAGVYLNARLNRPEPPSREPVVVENWRDYLPDGITIAGDPATDGTVVVELLDFQCPFCAQYATGPGATALDSVAVVVVHWPLPMHQYAETTAVVFECAVEQNKAVEMHDALFAGQKSFGTVPWRQFAENATVPDLAAFEECIQRPASSFPRIARGPEIAREIGARGTPTIIVNGLKLGSPPQSYADIAAAAKSSEVETGN